MMKKPSKGFEQQFASLGLQTPLKIKDNSRGSMANSQQVQVHSLWEITKAKMSQAKFGQVWASLGKFGQVWTSLGKSGQVKASWAKLSQ